MKINITQKLSLLTFMTVFCSAIYGAEQEQDLAIQQEIVQLAQTNEDYRNFIKLYKLEQASNDAWIYEKSLVNLPATDAENNFVFDFDVVKNSFNTGKTITATIVYHNAGQARKQQEIWTTAHPSYLTWSNAALIAGVVGASLTGYGYYNLVQDLAKKSEDLQIYEFERQLSVIQTEIRNNVLKIVYSRNQEEKAEASKSVLLAAKQIELLQITVNKDQVMHFREKMHQKDLECEEQARQALAAGAEQKL